MQTRKHMQPVTHWHFVPNPMTPPQTAQLIPGVAPFHSLIIVINRFASLSLQNYTLNFQPSTGNVDGRAEEEEGSKAKMILDDLL